MKLKIQKEDFTRALQSVQKVASNKSNNLSSENGLLIKAINDNIEIQANDYDMGIKTTIPGIIEESGEVFLWDPHLSELTRRIASEEIIVKFSGELTAFIVQPADYHRDIIELILPVRTY